MPSVHFFPLPQSCNPIISVTSPVLDPGHKQGGVSTLQENPRTRPQVLYVALVSRILQRLRFPRMLLHVKEELGPDAEAVLEGDVSKPRLSGVT